MSATEKKRALKVKESLAFSFFLKSLLLVRISTKKIYSKLQIKTYIEPIRKKIKDKLFDGNLKFLQQILNRRGYGLKIGIERLKYNSNSMVDETKEKFKYSDWGIVFQGNMQTKQASYYLQDSLKLIRLEYPDILIVISSYYGKNESELRKICTRYSCELVLSEDPGSVEPPFSPNIARQILTSFAGLQYLYNRGKIKAIKIRIDQRIANPDSLVFVEKVLTIIDNSQLFIAEPILVTSMNSYISIPGFASDMMQFGYLGSMLKYWAPTEVQDFKDTTNNIFSISSDEIQKLKLHPEVWLSLRYLRNFTQEFMSTELLSDKVWGTLIGVVDCETIGQQWSKAYPFFVTNYHSAKWLTVSQPELYEELKFDKWFAKYFLIRNN